MHPFVPMSPILSNTLPEGAEWVHQLKWDGFRLIADVDEGSVQLFSKNMRVKTERYPELTGFLSGQKGSFVLDGEMVVLDPVTGRPNFALMHQRDKRDVNLQVAVAQQPVLYIVFDLLEWDGENLRGMQYADRQQRLRQLGAGWTAPLFLIDNFEDGERLWDWVVANQWEGVVSKRLDSVYVSGKSHTSWYKRKTVIRIEAEAVGLIIKNGTASSLVLRKDGAYLGRVSSGLNAEKKELLLGISAQAGREHYFANLPDGLRGAEVRWFDKPWKLHVTGSELTEGGGLRHPRLL
ncbi:DNA ligase [Paenibacillaceae bacterium]|nr:DNA ligase [Paenibacillaceae bacterium]